MSYRELLDDLLDPSLSPDVRGWLRAPTISESEFATRLPDLIALGLLRRPPATEARVGLLLRHYGLGACAPESLAEIARRDGVDRKSLVRALGSAKTVLLCGVEDFVCLLNALGSEVPASLPASLPETDARTVALKASAQDVLTILRRTPREHYLPGLNLALERLSECCDILSDHQELHGEKEGA